PYDLTSHLHPRPPYLTSYIGVRRKTYHPNRISLRRTPRPELKPRFLPMEAARNTTRPMNTAAAINGQRSATSISTAKTANVMHRLTNTLLLGSDISSNETELSHRWRERALLQILPLKSFESYSSERPAV